MRRLAILLLALPICGAAGPATSCVEIGGASFWGATGWNHYVYLTNRCSAPVVCDVSTNVETESKTVSLSTNQTAQVSTSMNVADRVFVPVVSCDYP